MVVFLKLGSVRWIMAERVARRPRRKRQRWLLSGASGAEALATSRVGPAARSEVCRTSRRIPRLRRSKLIWLPL